MTEWRTLDWLPGYEISEDGALRSTIPRYKTYGGHLKGQKSYGYLRYCATLPSGAKRYVMAHRAVCEAWHGPPPSPTHHSAHSDGDKLNNHFTNLRWATPAENNADLVLHGTSARGERNPHAKLTWQSVREIRRSRSEKGERVIDLAQQYGVCRKTIKDIVHNYTWREATCE
jgi:hypothetical protein